MKRANHLFEQIIDLENLLDAFHKAQKGKQCRAEVREFRQSLHANLSEIRVALENRTFRFGDYRHFYICDPKTRLIQAAPFAQRVVHHAIINVLGPVFERRFIFDSYACRRGKGQHAALKRAEQFAGRSSFYLKMDIRKFYDTIDHAELADILRRQSTDQGSAGTGAIGFYHGLILYRAGAGIAHRKSDEPVSGQCGAGSV